MSNAKSLPDLDGLCARVGYRGVGRFLCDWLMSLGVPEDRILQRHDGNPYDIELPRLGLKCTLQYLGNARAQAQPQAWALNAVSLTSQYAPAGPPGWQGPWWGGISPHGCTMAQAKKALGTDCTVAGTQASFFPQTADGRSLVISFQWVPQQTRLLGASMTFLGGYLPWPHGAEEQDT